MELFTKKKKNRTRSWKKHWKQSTEKKKKKFFWGSVNYWILRVGLAPVEVEKNNHPRLNTQIFFLSLPLVSGRNLNWFLFFFFFFSFRVVKGEEKQSWRRKEKGKKKKERRKREEDFFRCCDYWNQKIIPWMGQVKKQSNLYVRKIIVN